VVRGTENVTVLFAISGDPVELGIADSVARPGRNFTGMTFLSLEIAGKRVEALKQAVPKLKTLAALSNTDHPGERAERQATEAARPGPRPHRRVRAVRRARPGRQRARHGA
jgi:putative ABC transport system substrate-binding protein